jgi:MerR family transcriptional regulator, light-induced transcriptional regulator
VSEKLLRIGELSRRVGVSVELLRAWERRYGLLAPERTRGGFRLYGDEDVGRVLQMRANLDRGFAAAEAARLVVADGAVLSETALADASAALAAALESFDDAAA